MWCNYGGAIDSPCECEHNNPDSLDARLFHSVVLAIAPAVTMDEASSLSYAHDKNKVTDRQGVAQKLTRLLCESISRPSSITCHAWGLRVKGYTSG